MENFDKISEKLKFYAYRLVDPRNSETFYIGKGCGNRVFDHIKESVEGLDKELNVDYKLDKIREIKKAGYDVCCIIHRHGLEEKEALIVEAALIDAYPNLTNKQNGYGSSDFGAMTVSEIQQKYALEELQDNIFDINNHKVLIVKINRSSQDINDIYNATRFAWRLAPERANKANYVLAVNRGIVIAIFKVDDNGWRLAIRNNFPELSEDFTDRYGFSGSSLESGDIYKSYCNKLIPQKFRRAGASNPIMYSWEKN